jgi:hypothetical protein
LEGGRLLPLVVVVAVLALAGCGENDDGPAISTAQTRALDAIERSFEEGDYAETCDRLTRSAQIQVGLMAHGDVESCVRDLRQAAALFEPGGGFGESGTVEDVVRTGPRADVRLDLDGWRSDIPMVEEDDRWKLDSFFGIPTDQAMREVSRAEREGPPDELEEDPDLVVTGAEVEVSLLTGFGHLPFSTCEFTFESTVEDDGITTWTHDFDRKGPEGSACGDIEQCGGPQPGERFEGVNPGVPIPWRGELKPDGDDAYVHEMDTCFWTCVGFFRGKLSMRFVRDGSAWRTEESAIRIGSRGFEMRGTFEAKSRAL